MLILDILIGLIGLGVVIFVHESGHFVAAKLSGITVEAFSIGWGKKLASFTRNGTEYRISMLPIGGYCKMKGEELLRKAIENSDDKIETAEGSLFSVSPFKRLLTYLAGPASNLLFAFAAMSFVWLVGFTFQSVGNKIVLMTDYPKLASQSIYPANRAGLETGDRIIDVNGRPIRNFQDLEQAVAPNPNERLALTVERDGKTVQLHVTPKLDKNSGAGIIGVSAWVDPTIGKVKSGSAAFVAGLKPGDTILTANGKKIANTMDYAELLKSQPDKISITYGRNGAVHDTTIVPSYGSSGSAETGLTFKINTYHSQRVGFFGAIAKGFQETGNTLSLTVKSIGLLFQGINFRQAVSGPVRITYYVGQIATQGFQFGVGEGLTNLLRFLSILSVALFFMNLLPIPALDGGLIVLAVAEMFTGRTVKPRFFYRYQVIGFMLVFGLIILTTFNDVFFLMKQ